jgi:5'-3' exonuclease
MGIQGLHHVIKESGLVKACTLSDINPGTCGIDASCFMYKGGTKHAREYFINAASMDKPWVDEVFEYVRLLEDHGFPCILVFDGQHHPFKDDCSKQRRLVREEAKEAAQHLEKQDDIEASSKKWAAAFCITSPMMTDCINACQEKGVAYRIAKYESEQLLAAMAVSGSIRYVVTEDSDMVAYEGVQSILFKLHLSGECELYSSTFTPKTLDLLGLPSPQLQTICACCRNDYLVHGAKRGWGIKKLYKLAQQGKLDDWVDDLPRDVREKVHDIVQMFTTPGEWAY